jgi:ATP-dependent DNA ligase
MQKIKTMRTAECVGGGFRYASKGRVLGSLLLGLYDEGGLLHHVGFTSNVPNDEKAAVTKKLPDLPETARILTFCYDTGERYLSVEGLFPLPE